MHVFLRSSLFLKRMRSLTFFIPISHVCYRYIYGYNPGKMCEFCIVVEEFQWILGEQKQTFHSPSLHQNWGPGVLSPEFFRFFFRILHYCGRVLVHFRRTKANFPSQESWVVKVRSHIRCAALRCKCMLLLNAACDELCCAALLLHAGVFTHTLRCAALLNAAYDELRCAALRCAAFWSCFKKKLLWSSFWSGFAFEVLRLWIA